MWYHSPSHHFNGCFERIIPMRVISLSHIGGKLSFQPLRGTSQFQSCFGSGSLHGVTDLRDRSSWSGVEWRRQRSRRACRPGCRRRRDARAQGSHPLQTDTTVWAPAAAAAAGAAPASPSDSTNVKRGAVSTRVRQSGAFSLLPTSSNNSPSSQSTRGTCSLVIHRGIKIAKESSLCFMHGVSHYTA